MDHPLVSVPVHDDLEMNALEGDALHLALDLALFRFHHLKVFGPDHHIHVLHGAEARIGTLELHAGEFHQVVFQHDPVHNIALSDEVRHKSVDGFVIDILGTAGLQDLAPPHDQHPVRHGQGFFLVVGHVNKGDAQGLLDALQLQLHFLSQFQVQGPERLVQKQHLRLIDQRPGNSYPLLLTAGKLIHFPGLVPLQVHQFQHPADPGPNLVLGDFFLLQSKGDIAVNV